MMRGWAQSWRGIWAELRNLQPDAWELPVVLLVFGVAYIVVYSI